MALLWSKTCGSTSGPDLRELRRLMAKSRAIITGAAGFIGSHVLDHCLAHGMDVVAVDNLSGGFRRNVSPAAQFVPGDLREAALVDRVWAEHGPFDYVYHVAAYAAEGLSHHVRRFNYENNLIASVNVLNAAITHRARHFVFTSSIAVYGTGQTPLREDAVPRPEDPYGISKYAFELDLQSAHDVFGLPFTIFRPHNVYGERQNLSDPYRNVIGIFLNQCRRGEPMTLFGDGSQTRAFSHVDDVAPLIARAPMTPGAAQQVFNVGADMPISVLGLAREVAAAMGVEPRIKHLPARPEVAHAFSDHAKAQAVFQPPRPVLLPDGLRRMAAWAKTIEAAPTRRFEGLELREKLPAGWK
jgi:UDP-glucose 4-epimerase